MTNNIKMLQKSIIQHLKNPLYHISNKLSKSLLSSAVIFVIHEDEVNIDLIRHTKQKESKTEKKLIKIRCVISSTKFLFQIFGYQFGNWLHHLIRLYCEMRKRTGLHFSFPFNTYWDSVWVAGTKKRRDFESNLRNQSVYLQFLASTTISIAE